MVKRSDGTLGPEDWRNAASRMWRQRAIGSCAVFLGALGTKAQVETSARDDQVSSAATDGARCRDGGKENKT